MVRALMARGAHPEQGFRAALGLMRLETRYGKERLEGACRRALFFELHSFRGVRNILESGLDRIPPESEAASKEKIHPNLRGRGYYS